MTDPTTTTPAKKSVPKKSNGAKGEKPTVTLNFSDPKYADLYTSLKAQAEADDRSLTTFILRLLKSNHDSQAQYASGTQD